MKRVFTNGCFDVLHRGHFELLKHCKTFGHVIVGINSDKSIKKIKGNDRPFFSEDDRVFMLKSCKYVDEVIIFDQETPYDLINSIKPDIIVKGGDYKKENVVGNDIADVKIFDYIAVYSTSRILGEKCWFMWI